MATLQEQIAQAKAAGYSDADIAKHLGQKPEHAAKFKTATDAGYKPEEIVAHLSGPAASKAAPQAAKPAVKTDDEVSDSSLVGAIAGAGTGFGKVMLGAQHYLGKGLDAVGADRAGKWLVDDAAMGRAKLTREIAPYKEKSPIATGGGELAGEIVATLPVGGVLAKGVGAVAPSATGLMSSLASGGFRTGNSLAKTASLGAKAADMGTRMVGGGVTGGVAAGLINPDDAATGAVVGAALPPSLAGAAKAGGYVGRSLYSLAQPFTAGGQERMAGSIINKFAKGGPTALNNAEFVPGSMPTLAEATGNAGIAGLQRSARDMPQMTNKFVEREAANAAARSAVFDDLAGDANKLDFFRASRDSAANDLYGQAAQVDVAVNMTPAIKNQITQLMKRPSIVQAAKQAKEWAAERGEEISDVGSMQGLHDMKMALDDEIGAAVRAGKGGQAKALTATKDKLLGVMETISPAYKEAKATYAEMSKPINQMEALQGLRLTDSKGNMTLAKVQGAIDGLKKAMAAPGVRAQKSLTTTQLGTLEAIRDDLLRQSNLGAGKSVGSNTFQNIATDNMISTLLPEKAAEIVGGKLGSFTGQLGQLIYNKPNEAIRNRLAELMLEPEAAKRAMDLAGRPILDGRRATALRDLMNRGAPAVYRSAPALSSDQ